MMMKTFVIGPQCSGKTTLVEYLRTTTSLTVVEMDEEVRGLHGGEWPKNRHYKELVLVPRILWAVRAMPEVMLFENHMSPRRTEKLRDVGFYVIGITVDEEELLRRNAIRAAEQGYPDASSRVAGQVQQINDLHRRNLIDMTISGQQPTELIAEQIIAAHERHT